jgi:hypothetical protein
MIRIIGNILQRAIWFGVAIVIGVPIGILFVAVAIFAAWERHKP